MPCCRRLVSCFCDKSGISLWCHIVDIFAICFSMTAWNYLMTLVINLQIQSVLQRATFDSNSQVGVIFQVLRTEESPPTYFRTNKVTSAFQEIVDAYGYVITHLFLDCHSLSWLEIRATKLLWWVVVLSCNIIVDKLHLCLNYCWRILSPPPKGWQKYNFHS